MQPIKATNYFGNSTATFAMVTSYGTLCSALLLQENLESLPQEGTPNSLSQHYHWLRAPMRHCGAEALYNLHAIILHDSLVPQFPVIWQHSKHKCQMCAMQIWTPSSEDTYIQKATVPNMLCTWSYMSKQLSPCKNQSSSTCMLLHQLCHESSS